MPVDEKRAQAVFLAAVEAADPVRQAAIVDRECASDKEMRQRVESLLRAHRETATVRDQPTATPFEAGPTLPGVTIRSDPSTASKAAFDTIRQPDSASEQDGPKEDEELQHGR